MQSFREQITISVEKQKLLTALTENKKKHIQEYLETYEKWKKEVKEISQNNIKHIDDNKINRIAYNLPQAPNSMEEDYEQAIQMITWHTKDTIELDQQKFKAFIMDDWEWTSTWNRTKTYYSNV
jgi:hypothetical protein